MKRIYTLETPLSQVQYSIHSGKSDAFSLLTAQYTEDKSSSRCEFQGKKAASNLNYGTFCAIMKMPFLDLSS